MGALPAEKLARMLATNEARYFGLAAHIDQMSRYAEIIARKLGFAASAARMLRGAAKLHDFGKLGTPDSILLKQGPLTAAERSVIELHTVIGWELLRDSDSEFLDLAATIALSHHERWDGSGYPEGLGGDEIPLEARIAKVADVFDSLTRERPYRPALRLNRALDLIRTGRGTQFDPSIVDAFFAAEPEIRHARSSTNSRPRPRTSRSKGRPPTVSAEPIAVLAAVLEQWDPAVAASPTHRHFRRRPRRRAAEQARRRRSPR